MSAIVREMDHVCNLVSGFESYLKGTGENIEYAKTAFRLNGINLPDVAGNEGFMDAIKAGGKKMMEMIANMLKSIKKFFFGMFGSKKAEAAKKAPEEIKKDVTEIKKLKSDDIKPEQVSSAAKKVASIKPKVETLHLRLERFTTIVKQERGSFSPAGMEKMRAAGFDNGMITELSKNQLELAGSFGILSSILILASKDGSLLAKLQGFTANAAKDIPFEAVVDTLEDFEKISAGCNKTRIKAQSCLAHVVTATEKTMAFLNSKPDDDIKLQDAGAQYLVVLTKYNNMYVRVIEILDGLSYECMWACKGATTTLTKEDHKDDLKKFEEFMHSDEPLKL